MAEYYQQLSEVDQFNTASNEDKLKFGDLYADELISSDERFVQDPELGEFLRSQISDEIKAEFAPVEPIEPEQTFEQFGENLQTVLGEGVGGDIVQTFGDIGSDISAVTSRGFGENLGALGENTANVLLHTAGIPGRLLAGMAQLPHALASGIMEKTGFGDSAANQWVKAQYAGLERDKQTMTIYQNALTQFEPDVLFAAGIGAAAGAGIHAYTHRALNGAAKLTGGPGFTATDAAIVNGWTTAVGEATVVTPALRVSEHYISESGYTEETKNVLRATLPVLLGVVSGVTLEARMDKMLRNPLVVDEIVSGAARGLSPVELGENVRQIVKAPTVLEDVMKNTNGRPTRESLTTYGENFNTAGSFATGAEFPPIRVNVDIIKPVAPKIIGKFHGTGKVIKQLDDFHYGATNYYGNGFYTTDTLSVAESYSKSLRTGKTPVVYSIEEQKHVNVFDMEEVLTPELRSLFKRVRSDLVDDALEQPMVTNTRELFDDVRDSSNTAGMSVHDVQEVFDGMQNIIKNQGYGAMAHIGGLKTDTPAHTVTIYLAPSKDVKIAEFTGIGPVQIANAMGQPDVAKTARTVDEAVNHFVAQPLNTAKGLQKMLDKSIAKKAPKEKLLKLQNMIVQETNRATKAQDVLGNLKSPKVDDALHKILEDVGLAPKITKAEMLRSDAVQAGEVQNLVADLLAKSGSDLSETGAKQSYMDSIDDAFRNNVIGLDDARRATAIFDDTSKGWLFNAERSKVLSELDKIGINGQTNRGLGEWAFGHLNNQSGYVDPAFIRTVGLHSAPLITGLETKDGELTWNTNKYLKYGALWHVIGYGGKAYRRIGANKIVRGVGSKVSKKFWEGIEHPVLRGLGKPLTKLRPSEGLEPEIFGIKKQFRRQKQQLRRQLDEFAIGLKKNYKDDELELISDFIEKEGDWKNVPRLLQEQASEIQGFLKQTRAQLIDSGVDPELVSRLGDNYLHRVYIPKMLKKPSYKNVKAKLKSIQAHYLKTRGKNADMRKRMEQMELGENDFVKGDKVFHGLDSEAKKIWVHEAQVEKLKVLRANGPVTEWNIVESGKKITANTDYTKAEREAMGESRDVALRLAVFFRETSHDIALGNIFKNIDVDPRWTMKNVDKLSGAKFSKAARENGFVKMPDKFTPSGVAKFGKLNGQWVHPDVAEVLGNMTKKRYDAQWKETIGMMNRKALTTWKVAKTAYNPGTHAINVTTNFHILAMDGRNPFTVPRDGIQTLVTKDKFFNEAIEAGLVDSGVLAGEWNLKQFNKAVNQLKPTADNYPLAMRAMANAYGAAKKVGKAPMVMYQWEDEVFKLGVFKQERLAGKTPEQALDAANKLFFDYSDVPSGVEALRDSGVVPFISWTYKIMPVIAKTAVDHPERLVAMIMAYKVASDYAYETQFGDKADAQMKLEREVRPDFQQKKFFGVGPDTQLRLSNDQKTGQARTLDVSRYIPGADLFADYGNSFPFGLHPLVSLIYGMKTNKHGAFGNKILPFEEPRNAFQESENFDAKMKHLTNTILPNIPFIPYTYSSDRIGNALVSTGDINENSGFLWDFAQRRGWNGKDYFGNDLDLSDEALSSVGIKINRMDVEQAVNTELGFREKAVRAAGGDVTRELNKDVRRFRSTPSRRLKQFQGQEAQQETAFQDLDVLLELLENAN